MSRCTTLAEALEQQERKSRLLTYFIVVLVFLAIVLSVCICYAAKVFCFRLKIPPIVQAHEQEQLRTPTPERENVKSSDNTVDELNSIVP